MKTKKLERLILCSFFLFYLIIGIYTLEDYGINIEEHTQLYSGFYWLDYVFNFFDIDFLKDEIKEIKFDLIVCKNDAFQKYGKDFKSVDTKIINVTPMGISNNYNNCDFYFKENELIKAPVEEMQNIFDNEYKAWQDRKKQIIVPASIGSDKNQKEIVDLIDSNLFTKHSILFAGKIYNQNYANYLKSKLDQKSIKSIFKFLTREELAREFLNSKLTMLTTDPRPAQP